MFADNAAHDANAHFSGALHVGPPAAQWPTLAMFSDDADPIPDTRYSGLSFDIGVDWTTAYFFRGIIQEKHGFIVQPGIELGYALNDNTTVLVGTWNSFHDAATGAGSSDHFNRHWYECDLYGGVRVALDQCTLSATYTFYTSPADAFDTVHEIDFGVSYDDSPCWNNKFAFNPEAHLAIETGANAADGQNPGIYLQLGIAPSFDWLVTGSHTVQITTPVTVGLSAHDYYQDANGHDHTFGFLDLGVDAAMDLATPAGTGDWNISGGVHLLILNGATQQLNHGDRGEVIARLGISASF